MMKWEPSNQTNGRGADMEINGKEVGDRLRQLRKARHLSLRQLGEKSGVHFSYISQIENGVIPSPGIQTLSKLANALGVLLEDVTGEGVQDTSTEEGAVAYFARISGLPPAEVRRWWRSLSAASPAEQRRFLQVAELLLGESEQTREERSRRRASGGGGGRGQRSPEPSDADPGAGARSSERGSGEEHRQAANSQSEGGLTGTTWTHLWGDDVIAERSDTVGMFDGRGTVARRRA